MNLDVSRRGGISYPIKIKKVIESALQELGLDYQYLKNTLRLSQDKVSDIEGEELSAYSWVTICDVLHLHYDVCQWGYDSPSHHAKLYQAWLKDELRLPLTPKLMSLIQKFEKRRKDESKLFAPGLRTAAAEYFKSETLAQARTPENF